MDRFILMGTSHCTTKWNPMRTEFEKVFDKPFANRAVSALSMESYFPRVLAIMDEFPNEKLYFIMEYPTSGRYENYVYNRSKEYQQYSILKHTFWPKQNEDGTYESVGNYQDHIFYYNANKLFNSDKFTVISDKFKKMLLRWVVWYEKTIIDELLATDAMFINTFIKHQGHEVVWFNTNSIWPLKPEIIEYNERYGLEYITRTNLFVFFANKKHRTDLRSLKLRPEIFPDGTHLNKEDWRSTIHKYFIPYFKELDIPLK